MSEEHRDRHPPNEQFPGEEQLSRLYREGSGDLPPANLDADILNAARQAVRSRSRRLYFFPSRKWVVPLSLAAALWVTVEVVLLRRNEIAEHPTLPLNAPSSVSRQVQELEEKAPAANEELDALPGIGRTKKEKRMTDRVEEMGKLEAGQSLHDEQQVPEEERAFRPRMFEPPSQPLQKVAPAELPAREQKSAETVLSAPAPASLPPSATIAGAIATDASKAQALPPKEWLAKIRELRRAGKRAEAEASLEAFKKRYPEYPVEQELELAR